MEQGYRFFEQTWCKLFASNDFISQPACWINFEAQYPIGSDAYAHLVAWTVFAPIIILAIAGKCYVNGGLGAGLFGVRGPKVAKPRIEPRP